jgi:hypothetical protein
MRRESRESELRMRSPTPFAKTRVSEGQEELRKLRLMPKVGGAFTVSQAE